MTAEALVLPGVGDIVGEGRFELCSQLGEGGMGTVFVARDRFLDCDLALKLLIPRYVGRSEREQRLLNEAEYLRRLRGHPHVVQLIDSGRLRDRNGWPWLSTEIMHGTTLDWVLIRTSLAIGRILEIARQLAEALVACHEAGVVHRDITPSNVFVLEGGSIKLFDFSHAADLRGPKRVVGAPERLTGIYETPGTVGYIGPEQAANAAPDASMDSFGFGVLVYELVSGSNPYKQFTDRDAFIQAQADGTLEAPRLQAWAYDAPEELAALVHDCMQRDASKRPEMTEILARIEAMVGAAASSESTELMPPPAASSDDVTATVDAPAIIATRRRQTAADVIGAWTVGPQTASVVPLAREPKPAAVEPAPTWAAPERESEEQTDVLAFARPPQLREAMPTTAPKIEQGPVFARPPELRPLDSGGSGGSDPENLSAMPSSELGSAGDAEAEITSTELSNADPARSRARTLGLVAGVGILVTILSWVAYSKVLGPRGDSDQPIDGGRDQSPAHQHHPAEPSESPVAPTEAETGAEHELVAETGGPGEIVPEVEPVEHPKPKSENGKPKNGNGKPENGKSENGKPENGKSENGKPESDTPPESESPECKDIEQNASSAAKKRDWKAVLDYTSRTKCWASKRDRQKLEVLAYANTGQWSKCVEAGEGSRDSEVQRRVEACKDSL